jgi:hypothetical protein
MARRTDGAHATVVLVDRDGTRVASWPLKASRRPDLALVDAVARLQIALRRMGYDIRLRDVCDAVGELFDLVGLDGLVVEMGGEAEGGEQLGVEEVVVTDDPIA